MSTDAAAKQEKKSLWDTIVIGTPVLLAVIGTVLAGRSSTEMVQAQYHRTVAAQNQSQASDQWGFFQSRKIRGSNEEQTINQLKALGNVLDLKPNDLSRRAARLQQQIAGVVKGAEAPLNENLSGVLGDYYDSLHAAVLALQQAAKASAAAMKESIKKLEGSAADPGSGARPALEFIGTSKLPLAKDQPDSNPRGALIAPLAAINPNIPKAIAMIEKREPEDKIAELVKNISSDEIHKAIKLGESCANGFDEACDPINRAFLVLDAQIGELSAEMRAVNDAASALGIVLQGFPADKFGTSAKLHSQTAILAAQAKDLRRLTDELGKDCTLARVDYNRRRLERESRYNQEIAYVMEIQVRKSDIESDMHRRRSEYFLYAMLAAQAGVTISTFAIAVRRKGLLWALAVTAGVTALTIGIMAIGFI